MRLVRTTLTIAALAAVPVLGAASSGTLAASVTTPYEQVGGHNGPCVITDRDTVTLTPSAGASFGPNSGVYTNCPS